MDRFTPYFVASTGCHLINIRNRQDRIFLKNRLVPDLRIHLMFVTPPGFGKSFWIEQFTGEELSMYEGTKIGHASLGKITAAGWVGTVRFGGADKETGDLKKQEQYGEAFTNKNNIVGVEEFSELIDSMKSNSRAGDPMVNAMLKSLDSGWCQTSLAAGGIKYRTNATIWAGTQPERFNITSGIGRRFFFMEFFPTQGEKERLQEADWEGDNIPLEGNHLAEIHELIDQTKISISKVESIEWTEDFKWELKQLNVIHYEQKLYKYASLGYWLMGKDYDKHVVIDADPVVKKLILEEWKWRYDLKKGPQEMYVLNTIKSLGGEVKTSFIKDELMDFGMNWEQSTRLIHDMITNRMVIQTSTEPQKLKVRR